MRDRLIYNGLKIIVVLLFFYATSVLANSAELDVSELITAIKKAITEAQKTAEPPYMNIPWMEGEINYVIKKEGSGNFSLYVVTSEGKYSTEAIQSIKFRIEPESEGHPWRVKIGDENRSTGVVHGFIENPPVIVEIVGVDTSARKVFISTLPTTRTHLLSVIIDQDTKIFDPSGKPAGFSDIKTGMKGSFSLLEGPEGGLKASSIKLYSQTNNN